MLSALLILLFAAPFIGGLIALTSGYKNEKLLKVFIAFAGGYIFSITILHLLPEVFSSQHQELAIVVLAGFFFQVFITRLSDGAEHGHLHVHQHTHHAALPIGLLISMCLHAFTEGLPLGLITGAKGSVNQTMPIGIALHEIPAAFALVSILQSEHLKKSTVWILLIVYASMAPLAVFIGNTLSTSFSIVLFERVLAFVAGIFLFISTTILFENTENHQFKGQKLWAILIGVAVATVAALVGS